MTEQNITRRGLVRAGVGGGIAAVTLAAGGAAFSTESKAASPKLESSPMPGAFVYTELQISVPFANAPWRQINPAIKQMPGFLNKTWLAGLGTGSLGGLAAFETIDTAMAFVTGYFPAEAQKFGVSQTTRVFDAKATEAASRDMRSAHFGTPPSQPVGAFVYTEVQAHFARFDDAPWRALNPGLKAQPGLIAKTWLYGRGVGSPGGFYAFATVADANRFAQEVFPKETAALNAAYTTRVFEAAPVEAASRDMRSPFFL